MAFDSPPCFGAGGVVFWLVIRAVFAAGFGNVAVDGMADGYGRWGRQKDNSFKVHGNGNVLWIGCLRL